MIIDFEVPLQSRDSVSNITRPGSWSYSILTQPNSKASFGSQIRSVPYVLHCTTRSGIHKPAGELAEEHCRRVCNLLQLRSVHCGRL